MLLWIGSSCWVNADEGELALISRPVGHSGRPILIRHNAVKGLAGGWKWIQTHKVCQTIVICLGYERANRESDSADKLE
jgi:hypothetical protein